ncbi:hypothetical protein Avbf_08820 [Armadillidium vulgare]|nr:hypothetical protein Avbf_08820 [Armadillidium vulgare]
MSNSPFLSIFVKRVRSCDQS